MTTSNLRTLALSLLLLSPVLASAAEGSARARTELLISTFKKVKSDAPAGANESLYKELDALIDYDAAIDRAIQTRASKLTPQQKADFKARFRSLIRDVAYPSSGKFFRKAKLTLDPKAADETTSTLRARVPEEDLEANLTLKWAKSADGQLKVVDVLFDGDSMVQDYQNQFAGVIDREGVPGLFKKLEERRAALQKGAKAP